MTQLIKKYLCALSLLLLVAVPAFNTVAIAADPAGCGGDSTVKGELANGANAAAGSGISIDCTDAANTGPTDSIKHLARNIVEIFSFVVGAVAVIMVIYGGLRYIASGGDSNSVGAAKRTLIYAIIGLVIVALAQLIIHFVLRTSEVVSSPCKYDSSLASSDSACKPKS